MISQYVISVSRVAPLLALAFITGCSSQPMASSAPAAGPAARQTTGERAAKVALGQVGTPYRYGGSTPAGFDCSGLVQYSYLEAGKMLPRTTRQLWDASVTVQARELQAGDILFFEIDGKMSHVGMYVGGRRFVHAPSSGKTVAVASLENEFYQRALVRAGRPE